MINDIQIVVHQLTFDLNEMKKNCNSVQRESYNRKYEIRSNSTKTNVFTDNLQTFRFQKTNKCISLWLVDIYKKKKKQNSLSYLS